MGSVPSEKTIELHGRTYHLPTRPVVIVCVDGFDPTYLQAGIEAGILPTMARWVQSGFHATATCAMPSVTNPNNLCIITGVPTSVHGISGNYYLDKDSGEEVMVLDASKMRGETILERMARAGVRVAAITAKDKLRRIINHGLEPGKGGAICFSSQFADQCTVEEHGISDVEAWLGKSTPPQYSGELSLFVLDAGLKLLQEKRADLFYLTLSDYIQHKHAPGSDEADDFFRKLDARLGEFERLGAVVAVTGDHGMSDKSDDEGKPNAFFLEDFLNEKFPQSGARVMCPIADPFVKHHGALGGFVRVHLTGTDKSAQLVEEMIRQCQQIPQVEVAMSGKEAAAKFEMPEDREGELVVIARSNAVIGSRKEAHDLSQLDGHRLRSHGGLSEQHIPLLRSVKADMPIAGKSLRNFDVFDLALNY
ncbi:alkaline-phosphatase-like protein [Neohortaea acidophila]|uniref:Alkaline-phosphatase-like protein n=1 Tax=Neohortaea acidophila TaxID=245834 RepID=A0A6A6Q388_9PEZI|nr:alkaline-phosphatase-like protein [Neohortaea acidophila]KAF2486479.1 alkaline-phosphatase-like protein [Neohortaea acidophila]